MQVLKCSLVPKSQYTSLSNLTIACLIKIRMGQFMSHAWKQLFFGREAYPSKTCPICNSSDADTWLHVLLKCKQQHIHALITKWHNKVVWEVCRLIMSNKVSRHYTLMNAGTYNEWPREIPCQHGYCHAHVVPKDAIATPCLTGHIMRHRTSI